MATTTTTSSTTTIDDLPESLLTHIISFLPVVGAIHTAPVSSKWRRLWCSTPILHLCIFSFASFFNHSESRFETRQHFAEFATKVIILRNSCPLHKFDLSFDCRDNRHQETVDIWIWFAISFKCKLLFLSLSNHGYGLPSAEDDDEDDNFCIYSFDFSPLMNSSIEELKLQGCNFLSPSASITSLKFLYLENYDFQMDGSDVSEVLPLCVNLELLSINGTGDWENLYISSSSLKELILLLVDCSVEIYAPNLRTVSFDQDANSLVEACLRFSSMDTKTFYCWSHIIASLTHVERLTVDNMWIGYRFDQIDKPVETTGHDEDDTDSDTESIRLTYSEKIRMI